ncbi:MAG: gamma-butyrobetaine hydroxylase-like domain-containing protein [Janthinobacterium lividum]
MTTVNWPQELRLKDGGRTLTVAYADATFDLPAEYLRVTSPSAEVQGHTAAEKRTVGGKRHVVITAVDPVGHYAVKLVFDDGHDSGLFTWDYLHELGAEHVSKWASYLAELDAKTLSRDVPSF